MIELHDLALAAPDGRLLLQGLDLEVPGGGSFLLLGPSGCGKSLLLRVLAGTERPLGGRVRVGGIGVWPGAGALALAGRLRVGLAFPSGGLVSNLSLRENLALPLRFRGLPDREVDGRVDRALERLRLGPVAGLRPHALSESARKHGNLARVAALEPDLVLLDDPLEGLDSADRMLACDLIREWIEDPAKTVLIAQEEAEPFADRVPDHLRLRAPLPLEIP